MKRLFQGFYETRIKYFLYGLPANRPSHCFTAVSPIEISIVCNILSSDAHHFKAVISMRIKNKGDFIFGIRNWKEVVKSYFVFYDHQRDHLLSHLLVLHFSYSHDSSFCWISSLPYLPKV